MEVAHAGRGRYFRQARGRYENCRGLLTEERKDEHAAEGGSPLYVDVTAMITRPELLYAVITQIEEIILNKHHEIKAIGSHGIGGNFLVSLIILNAYNH